MGNSLPLPEASRSTRSLHCSSPPNILVGHRSKRLYGSPTQARCVPIVPDSVLGRITDDLRVHYDLGRELGRGRFGVIRLCTNKVTGECFACKSIPKVKLTKEQDVEDVRREIEILRKLSAHPNVVGLKDAYEDEESVHLVMELCEGGELFDQIVGRRFYPENEAAVLFKSLVEVVKYCHELGVIHRDLKPENILLSTDSPSSPIKVADFGLALLFTPGDKFRGTTGSAYYIAPEILKGFYSKEVDVWSAGVVLYILLCGGPPFWGKTDQAIFEAILDGDIDLSSDPWGGISSGAKDLISRMLCPNPKERITPAEILRHPWILGHTSRSEQREVAEDSSEQDRPARTNDAVDATCASTSRSDVSGFQEETCLSERFSLKKASPATVAMDHLLPEYSPDLESMPAATRVLPISSPSESSSDSPGSSTPPRSTSRYASSRSSSSALPASESFDGWASLSQVADPTFSEFLASISHLFPEGEGSQGQEQDGQRSRIANTGREKDTVMVDSAKGRCLVVYDRSRRRIGWKCLEIEQDSLPCDSRDCKELVEERATTSSATMLCLSSCPLIPSSQFPQFQQAQVVF